MKKSFMSARWVFTVWAIGGMSAISTEAWSSDASTMPKRLTLDSALRLALDQNRLYRVTELDAQTARDQVTWGKSGALPKADITGSYVNSIYDTRQKPAVGPATTSSNSNATTAALGVNGSWTFFEGLSSLAAHARLAFGAEGAEARRRQAREDLAAFAILAYSDVVRQRNLLAALDSAVVLSRERARITEGKYKLGSVSKLDKLQAELDLNEDLSARLRQAVVLTSAKLNLAHLLSWPDDPAYEVEDSISLAAVETLRGLHEEAYAENPSLKQAEASRNVADAGLREYVGHLFPSLAATAGYNYSLAENEVGSLRSNQALGWSYGVNMKWNIFDGLSLPVDYHAAQAARRRADLQYQEARAQLETSLRTAEAAFTASHEILALEVSNVGVARENVGIAMERLRLGTIASLELRTAQEKFIAAETRLVSARFEAKRSETEWLRLAGRLTQSIARL